MNTKILKLLNEIYPLQITEIEVTNELYRCKADKGQFYARITNYKSFDEQIDEIRYTKFLYENGISVPAVVPSLRHNLLETITLDKAYLTVMYETAPGVHLQRKEWNSFILRELGRQIGKLHRVSRQYEQAFPENHINHWYDNEEYAFLKYIPEKEKKIREKAAQLLNEIKGLPRGVMNYGLLHGDLCLENVLVDKDSNITMIDFQDCEKHFYIFDLAVTIYSAMEYSFTGNENITDYGRSIAAAIIIGYQEQHHLSQEMIDKLPLFIRLKEMFEYSLMHMYWNQDTLSEEQVRIMNHFRIKIENNHTLLNLSEMYI
ncbi:phosphotransferase enzyme family protein [Oceanobacillus kimchii]|uniref:phosphotransferase enzyme family protein n=1 Tax=Oceanobacillus kimchii TaxID=746691 RepID=UPI003C75E726